MNGSLAVAATLTALQCGLSAAGMSTAAVQPGLAQQTCSEASEVLADVRRPRERERRFHGS